MAPLVPKSIKSSLSQVFHLSSEETAAFEAVSQVATDWQKRYSEFPGALKEIDTQILLLLQSSTYNQYPINICLIN